MSDFNVETCHGGRDVWHADDLGPMALRQKRAKATGPNTYMNLYECMACHATALVGLDADNRIVAELVTRATPSPDQPTVDRYLSYLEAEADGRSSLAPDHPPLQSAEEAWNARGAALRNICGVVSLSGPHGEPLACGFKPHDDGPHSWATLPTFVVDQPSVERIISAIPCGACGLTHVPGVDNTLCPITIAATRAKTCEHGWDLKSAHCYGNAHVTCDRTCWCRNQPSVERNEERRRVYDDPADEIRQALQVIESESDNLNQMTMPIAARDSIDCANSFRAIHDGVKRIVSVLGRIPQSSDVTESDARKDEEAYEKWYASPEAIYAFASRTGERAAFMAGAAYARAERKERS